LLPVINSERPPALPPSPEAGTASAAPATDQAPTPIAPEEIFQRKAAFSNLTADQKAAFSNPTAD